MQLTIHSPQNPTPNPALFGQHLRETLQLSLPVVVGQVGTMLMGVQDNLMVGWVSTLHLSAATLANSLYFILAVIAIGLTYSISPLVAAAIGAGKPEETGHYLKQGVWVGTLASGAIMALCVGLIAAMPYLQQPESDVALAAPYMAIITASTPFMVVFLVYKQYADGLGDTKAGMYITLVGLLMNTLLNYGLIFGHWGLPRLELIGAAWATLISRAAMLGMIVWYVHRARRFRDSLAAASFRWQSGRIREIAGMGLPIGIQYFFEVAAFSGSAILMGWLADASTARAAHQIALSMASVTFMFCGGLAEGASIRVGNHFGAQDKRGLILAGKAGLALGVGSMVLFAGLFIALRHQIPMWFGAEGTAVGDIAATLCLFAAGFQLFDGTQVVASGLLRGMQDTRFPTVIMFIGYWIVSLPLSYVLAFHVGLGVYGFWTAYIVSLCLVAILLSWRFARISQRFMSEPVK